MTTMSRAVGERGRGLLDGQLGIRLLAVGTGTAAPGTVAHVAARAERGAGCGEEDAADVGVGLEALEDRGHARVHVGVERVAAFGAVEGDDAHAVADLREHDVGAGVDAHGCSS